MSNRNIFKFVLVALMGISLCSCEKKQTEFYLSDLQGLWLENNTKHYVRFTEDPVQDDTNYFWGCEWDEAEDVHEADLVYHGDGWFKYRLNNEQLLEVQMMDYGWADIPKQYIMVTLTSSHMTYHPKDYKNETISFTKQ